MCRSKEAAITPHDDCERNKIQKILFQYEQYLLSTFCLKGREESAKESSAHIIQHAFCSSSMLQCCVHLNKVTVTPEWKEKILYLVLNHSRAVSTVSNSSYFCWKQLGGCRGKLLKSTKESWGSRKKCQWSWLSFLFASQCMRPGTSFSVQNFSNWLESI